PVSLALLALSTLIMHIVNTQAAYLRAHRREPMLWALVPLGVAIAITLFFTARDFETVRPMFIGYTCCVLIFGLGIGSWIFFSRRRVWHHVETNSASMS